MENVKLNGSLASVDWLNKNLQASNIVILDASIPKVSNTANESNALSKIQIKGARFIDLKNIFSESDAEFPNTMLSENEFSKVVRSFGINSDSAIIVYDEFGIYSSARAWWMFKAMGHDNVAVLDGGLPEWMIAGFEVEKKILYSGGKGNFEGKYNQLLFRDFNDILEIISQKNSLIIDARAEERFRGLIAEPRVGLRRGHIPTSVNLPYATLIRDHKMLDENEISSKFSKMIEKNESVIFSCGSGITACILALGAEMIGVKNISVYDGSWTEWGSKLDLPIEKD